MQLNLRTVTHHSPLGEWHMTVAEPGGRLAGFSTALWDVKGVTHYGRESILPSGGVEILFNLDAPQLLLDPDDPCRRTTYREVWVSGLQQRHLVVESLGPSHMIGVRLTPTGAWRFFGLPLEEITDRVLDLDLVLGRSLLDLREQLGAHPDPGWRLGRLASFVARRIVAGPAIHPAVVGSLALLDASHGQVSIAALLPHTGLSQKHLIRKFREQVGLAPKRYARILRFRRAVAGLHGSRSVDPSALALACGYYDQAHFNRDFRRFSGAAPGDFLRQQLPDEVTSAMEA